MSRFDLYEMNFRQDKNRQQKRTVRTFTDDIDAIAYGVAAWFEENTGYSENVVGMTVEIARKLGLPESAIRKWAARRANFNAERVKLVKPLLQRLCSEPATDRLRLQKH